MGAIGADYFDRDASGQLIHHHHGISEPAGQEINGGAAHGGGGGGRDGNTDDYTRLLLNAARPTYQNTMTGDSAKAYDYLMGNTPAATTTGSSGVAQVRAPGVAPVEPTTPMPGTTTEPRREGGNPLSLEQRAEKADPNSWGNLTDSQKASWFADNPDAIGTKLQNYIEKVWPFKDTAEFQKQQLITQGMDPTTGYKMATTQALPGSPLMQLYAQQYAQNQTPTAAAIAEQDKADAATRADAQATAQALANENGSIGFSSRSEGTAVGGGNRVSDSTLSEHVSQQDRAGERSDARGGFLNNGKFDQRYAYGGGIAALSDGGLGSLGGYSDGGRLLRGPGDGVSDSIPATIGNHQPARLADGEFVVPARIVSELGNGSTEAGARQLYAMMDRIQAGRKKTVGKNKVAANSRAAKHLPA